MIFAAVICSLSLAGFNPFEDILIKVTGRIITHGLKSFIHNGRLDDNREVTAGPDRNLDCRNPYTEQVCTGRVCSETVVDFVLVPFFQADNKWSSVCSRIEPTP